MRLGRSRLPLRSNKSVMMSTEPPAKRAKAQKLIATHSGTFHADEALSVHLLRSLHDYQNARLIRTRDPAKLAEADIVVDVGGVYDPSTHRYDHHQRGFSEVYDGSHHTKLSSAGLVYKHFAPLIIATHLGASDDDPRVPILVAKLYDDFVEALDGIDNGIPQFEATSGEISARYKSRTDLSSRVARLNPSWDEPSNDITLDLKFEQASSLAGQEFFSALDYLAKSWLPAREIVKKAVESRQSSDQTGRLIVFEQFAPWKEHLFELEKTLHIPDGEKPLYIVYPDESGKWRIQAVPKSPESFDSRKALPEPWRGLRDEELSQKTGVPGCIFIHASGFIGGHSDRAGALKLAKLALDF